MVAQKAIALLAMPWSARGGAPCHAKTCPIPIRLPCLVAGPVLVSRGQQARAMGNAVAGRGRPTTAIKGPTPFGRPRPTTRGGRVCLVAVCATSTARGRRARGWCRHVMAGRHCPNFTGRPVKSTDGIFCCAVDRVSASVHGRRGSARRLIRAGRPVSVSEARRSIALARRRQRMRIGRPRLGRTALRRCRRSFVSGRRLTVLRGRVWCQTGETTTTTPCGACPGTKAGNGACTAPTTVTAASAAVGSCITRRSAT